MVLDRQVTAKRLGKQHAQLDLAPLVPQLPAALLRRIRLAISGARARESAGLVASNSIAASGITLLVNINRFPLHHVRAGLFGGGHFGVEISRWRW